MCVLYSTMLVPPTECLRFLCSMMEYDTENMNSEEIYSSLRGVTEAIQSFSYRSQEDLNEPIRPDGKRDDAVSHLHQATTEGKQLMMLTSTCEAAAVPDFPSFIPNVTVLHLPVS